MNSDLEFVLVLQSGGELLDEFRSLYDVYLWPDFFKIGAKIKSRYLILKITKKLFSIGNDLECKLFIRKLRSRYSVKLIYSNTARNGELLFFFRKYYSVNIILHVHEGGRTLDLFNGCGFVNYCIASSDKIITVSESVKRVLIEKFNASQEIIVIPGGIETNHLQPKEDRLLLREVGIADDKIIIMCCGWMDWHKGTDFFIQLARYLSEKNEKLHFVWVGGHEKDLEYKHLQFDIEKMNLSDRVTIITSKSNASSYINCADIFLMLSREESFSLVTLEAGIAKKPVLCFDQSGGPTEIVAHDPRFIVPYGDILKMSERITDILNDREERSAMSKYLYERVIENYSIEKCASTILKLINRKLKGD